MCHVVVNFLLQDCAIAAFSPGPGLKTESGHEGPYVSNPRKRKAAKAREWCATRSLIWMSLVALQESRTSEPDLACESEGQCDCSCPKRALTMSRCSPFPRLLTHLS